jgi:hypothetical protein
MTDVLDSMLASFPSELKKDIHIIVEKVSFQTESNPIGCFEVVVGNDSLNIPERIYYETPKSEEMNPLTITQRLILNCFYSRHYNGYLREECLKNIISFDLPWVVPYVIRLMGEYVTEILDIIEGNTIFLDRDMYKTFLLNNPKFTNTTKSRIISYWDCYFRKDFPNIEGYAGSNLLKFLNKLTEYNG